MVSLHITLSGGFEVRSGSGEAIDLHGRKNQALLAYLALSPGESCSRDKLVALLWNDRDEQHARASLRQALVELRRATNGLKPAPLVANRSTVSLDAGAIEVDVATFERAIAEGTPDAVGRAVELYQGDLLDGFATINPAFEEWLRIERTRLHERAREAFSRLVDHQVPVGETEAAIATAGKLQMLDSVQEPVYRSLMWLYARKGDRALAIRQYQACKNLLKAELGLEPDTETEKLVADIRSGAVTAGEVDYPGTSGGPSTVVALPLPDKPSVAVMPFINNSGQAEQEYFAESITESIITGLTRFSELFVIAWASSVAVRDGTADVQQIGHRLGVANIVEGSVRKVGNRVRVTAQLIDAASGHRVWAEHYERDLDDVFAVQDEITKMIVATLAGRIEEAGHHRAVQKPVKDVSHPVPWTQVCLMRRA